MAWVGYNLQSDVESMVKLTSGDKKFTTASSPITIAEVERFNLLSYNYINNSLRVKGVVVPVTDPDDMLELSLINTYLTVEIVDTLRYKLLEGNREPTFAKRLGDMGRALLQRFLDGKEFFSSNTTQGGFVGKIGLVDSTIADEDPKFTMAYKW